jgi:Flp pilus assembly protein TadD
MALEFSGPKAAFTKSGSDQAPLVRALASAGESPAAIRQAIAGANATDWRERGAIFEKMRFFATAYADYARSIDLDASNREALFGLAITAVPAGKQTEAVRLLNDLIQSDAGAVTPRIALSRLMSSIGRMAAAVEAAESALKSGKDHELVLEELAALYSDEGDVQKLESVVEQLKQVRPSSAKTHYYAASAMFLRGEFAQAIGEATKSAAADDTDADALNLKGAALASLGKREEARTVFEAALLRAPEDASIHANLGLLALDEGDARRSVKLFGGALSLDPASEVALQGLQRAMRQQ